MEFVMDRKDWEARVKQSETMIKQFKAELLMWEIIYATSKAELEKLPVEDHDTVP